MQYDELDALFTQFILNSSVGVSPGWLEAFNTQLSDWTGFSLDKNINSRYVHLDFSSASREGGFIGLIITLVPKVFTFVYHDWGCIPINLSAIVLSL